MDANTILLIVTTITSSLSAVFGFLQHAKTIKLTSCCLTTEIDNSTTVVATTPSASITKTQ